MKIHRRPEGKHRRRYFFKNSFEVKRDCILKESLLPRRLPAGEKR